MIRIDYPEGRFEMVSAAQLMSRYMQLLDRLAVEKQATRDAAAQRDVAQASVRALHHESQAKGETCRDLSRELDAAQGRIAKLDAQRDMAYQPPWGVTLPPEWRWAGAFRRTNGKEAFWSKWLGGVSLGGPPIDNRPVHIVVPNEAHEAEQRARDMEQQVRRAVEADEALLRKLHDTKADAAKVERELRNVQADRDLALKKLRESAGPSHHCGDGWFRSRDVLEAALARMAPPPKP